MISKNMNPRPTAAKYTADVPLAGSARHFRRTAKNGASRKTPAYNVAIARSKSSTRSPIALSGSLVVSGCAMCASTSRKREKCQKYGASSLTGVMFSVECDTIEATCALVPDASWLTMPPLITKPGAAYGCCSGRWAMAPRNRSVSARVNAVRLTTMVESAPVLLSCAATSR